MERADLFHRVPGCRGRWILERCASMDVHRCSDRSTRHVVADADAHRRIRTMEDVIFAMCA
jgi:hypothetical protein